ncbi:MAG: hypothetical protein TQ35_0003810 [Candidatus Aramenus sulfurataquae]|jgi:hypothetical protein|uniref:Uncharacterized protein n=2 Tax=Candidatus Aramenus sulfurataquae TaxID=1326980 RepID=A0AAE3K1E5_9CREN|nr:hypothetical protein [Candidatus Aramenus sulfurataquae]
MRSRSYSRNARGSVRTIVVRLFPSEHQKKKLGKLADVNAKMWNEVNHERRQ